jgi:hypothetical protein
MRPDRLHLLDAGVQIFDSLPVDESQLIHIVKVKAGVSEDALSHLVELMLMMEVFDGLLEAYGDEEPDDDGGNVDEEIAPGAGGVVGGMDVEHRSLLLRILPALRKLDWNWRLLCMRWRRGRQLCRIRRGV